MNASLQEELSGSDSESVMVDENSNIDAISSQQWSGWSNAEHAQFLQGLRRYGTNWKKIEEYMITSSPSNNIKTSDMIRKRAIAYFKKHEDDIEQEYSERLEEDHEHSFISTPEGLASAFLTHPRNVANLSRDLNRKPQPGETNFQPHFKIDTMSLVTTGYKEQCEKLNIEELTKTLDEEVNLSKRAPLVQDLPTYKAAIEASKYNQGCENISELLEETSETSETLLNEATENKPNFKNIYAFMAALFDPERYPVEELANTLSPQDREILQVLLHNLAISLSTQQFQEEYSTYVHQILKSTSETQTLATSVNTSGTFSQPALSGSSSFLQMLSDSLNTENNLT